MNATPVNESSVPSLSNQNQAITPVLWNPEAAGGWSLIFNPVFGSILVLMNWQALGIKEKIRNSQIWLIVSIVMLVIGFFLPSPFGTTLTLSYLLIWYFSAAKPQAKYIKERWGNTYPRRSWLWPLAIAIVALMILYGSIFFIAFVQAMLSQQ